VSPGGGAATLTLHEAADRLGVHYMTAYRYVRTGQLPARRQDGRWEVAVEDVTAFQRARAVAPAPGRGRGAGTATAASAANDTAADDPAAGDGMTRYRARLLERLLAGDEPGAWRVVESALVARLAPDRAHLDLIAPCLVDVGDRWAHGTISVGDEHLASAVATRLVARLAPLCARRGRSRGTVVLAGPAGETHNLPILLATNVLRARGWEVVELGSDTPTAEVVAAARGADRLRAVGVSVGSQVSRHAASATLAAVRAQVPGVAVLAGGPGVPDEDTARRLGADGWARDAAALDDLLAATERHGPVRRGAGHPGSNDPGDVHSPRPAEG
jgi:excisionase family DNA binding protein